MEPGDVLDLEVTDVAHGGVFVGRHPSTRSAAGRVVFVPDAIPGERVRVRLADVSHESFWRAETMEVLDASPHRRAHVWRHADLDVPPENRPGGADFGHIHLDHQRQLKLKVVRDALDRIGGVRMLPVIMHEAIPMYTDRDEVVAEETPDGTGWRTRVSVHVDADGRVGPYAARSHRVIPVADLPLATPEVEAAALAVTGARPGRIDLVQPADGRVRVIPRPQRAAHRASHPRGRRRARPAQHGSDPAREVVIERAGGRDFRVDAGGFWQVHRMAADTLVRVVADALEDRIDPDAWNLDLYGGVGLFAATIARLGGPRVTSVESDSRATDHAADNLSEWAGARAATGRVDRWLQRLRAEASGRERERLSRGVVVLDPPRSGAGRDVVESVVDIAPATIVYVACDPVALARDLNTFGVAGYETRRVDAVDLFPNSHHVEAVAVLTAGDSLRT